MSYDIGTDLDGVACSAGNCFLVAETLAQAKIQVPVEVGLSPEDDTILLAIPICGEHAHLMRMGGELTYFDSGA